ncbi:MAG: NapC/NirT family cytochrome c [Burkholderiales bacterium]|nr:NapC/NirT family cytochrome c [Burkholderiales bacterium]
MSDAPAAKRGPLKALSRAGLGLLAAGAVFGVLFWGGFNTVMEATNDMAFCIGCHEMRVNVYEEYKKSPHYQNASGVRATCADCHVPKQWVHKFVRKVRATNELAHHLRGTIDTPEKFNEKRAELAQHVWDEMKANNSRECRNCHSWDAMAFHKQSARASEKMQAGIKEGQTCIDCHKGIAHTLPKRDD